MRILLAGRHDWANFAHRLARAFRDRGVDARVLVQRPHPYGYPEEPWAEGELDAWAESGVDWLIGTGDDAYDFLTATARSVRHRNIAVVHGGSAYRDNAKLLNGLDVQLGARVAFIGADSMRLAGSVPAYPFWNLVEQYSEPDERRDGVLHCPSKRSSKGTKSILAAAEKAGTGLTLIENARPSDVIAAMGKAAVYIDELNHHVGGIGTAGFEAAAMGCAVISDGRHWPVSLPWTPPFQQVRDRDDLANVLVQLRGSDRAVDAEWYIIHARRDHAYAKHYCSAAWVTDYWLRILGEHAQ